MLHHLIQTLVQLDQKKKKKEGKKKLFKKSATSNAWWKAANHGPSFPEDMSRPLAGRVCIVTGASRGIGKGIALQLGEAGATVYITGKY